MTHTTSYSDTTHGRFIQHMDLARLWLQANGRHISERAILRTKDRLTTADLQRRLREQGVAV
jgi:hypothetical protein